MFKGWGTRARSAVIDEPQRGQIAHRYVYVLGQI